MNVAQIHEAIWQERNHQERKYPSHSHELPGWMLIMRTELAEAEHAWMKEGDHPAMAEILQVIAVGFAALEECCTDSDWSYVEQLLKERWLESYHA